MSCAVRASWLALIALALVAGPPAPAAAAEKVTFVMSWAPDARWAAEFLAKERGYFAEEGLEVSFANQRGSLAALQQVGAGSAEFGAPDSGDVIFAREKGVPVKAITLVGRNTGIAFMSLKETNITKPQDLVGKKVGVQRASATWVGFQALMGKYGVDIDKLDKTETAFGLEVLLLKKVDIRPVMIFNEYVLAQHKGIPVNVMWLPDFGLNLPGLTISTNEKTLKERPKVVQSFVHATMRAREEAIKDKEAAMDALLKNVPDLDRAYQEKVWDMLVEKIWGVREATADKPLGWNDPALYKIAMDTLKQYGGLKNAPPLDEVYDNRFIEAYHRRGR
jgi:NitT/TauT family transport system substrate-binding protein